MYKKQGYPEVSDFVIVTIKRVEASSAFVGLDEYDNKEGMIHVSELSRRWIRNIRSYLPIGRKLVCKVMDVDKAKGHINLSVRRVGAAQERNKEKEWADEKKANDILEVFAKMNNITVKQIYEKIGSRILDEYGSLYPVFQDISKEGQKILDDLGVENKIGKKLTELIQKRIVPPIAKIAGKIIMSSTKSDGLEIIKKAIIEAGKISKKKKADFEISYVGAPEYKFAITGEDFKIAEDALKEISEYLEKFIGHNNGTVEVKRD